MDKIYNKMKSYMIDKIIGNYLMIWPSFDTLTNYKKKKKKKKNYKASMSL
ncbi:hypothetical protein HanPSC8_Chr00c051g0803061 [Helianthus annuus]|nr:hypothetical protein HanPSC8_Chr00c051g0803061 [Helianthus annuus]